jgi:hypothetical protein
LLFFFFQTTKKKTMRHTLLRLLPLLLLLLHRPRDAHATFQCASVDADRRTQCRYVSSCAHSITQTNGTRPDDPVTSADKRDKLIQCSGDASNVLQLRYVRSADTTSFAPTTDYCRYTASQVTRSFNFTLPPSGIPASSVWLRQITNAFLIGGTTPTTPTPAQLIARILDGTPPPVLAEPDEALQQLRTSFMVDRVQDGVAGDTTASVCSYLKAVGAIQCRPPYVSDGTSLTATNTAFCVLGASFQVQCGVDNALTCTVDNALDQNGDRTYVCVHANDPDRLTMACHVTQMRMRDLLDLSGAALADACNQMAYVCASPTPIAPSDVIDCRFPLTLGGQRDAVTGRALYPEVTLCDYAADYAEIWISCNGACLHCMSQHNASSDAGTLCRPVGAETSTTGTRAYWSRDLYLNCLLPGTSLAWQQLYAQRDAILRAQPATLFSCYNAYLQNSTAKIDPLTGQWVSDATEIRVAYANTSVAGTSTGAAVRRLLTDADVDENDDDAAASSSPARRVYLGRVPRADVVDHRTTGTRRYASTHTHASYAHDMARRHLRHFTLLGGRHILDADAESAPWLVMPPRHVYRATRALLRRDANFYAFRASQLYDAAQLHHGPSYHVMSSGDDGDGDDDDNGDDTDVWTIARRLHAAQRLYTLMRRAHPIRAFTMYQTRSAAHANAAMLRHWSASLRHVVGTRFAAAAAASHGRRLFGASSSSSSSSSTGASAPAAQVITLPLDPLGSAYGPTCRDILQRCDNSRLHCNAYDTYYVFGRKNRNNFCQTNLITSCHVPNQTVPYTYHLACDAGLVLTPHDITCTYDVGNTVDCFYACTINTPRMALVAYPVPASMLLDASLDTHARYDEVARANFTWTQQRCSRVRQIAMTLTDVSSNFFWCLPPLAPVSLNATVAASASSSSSSSSSTLVGAPAGETRYACYASTLPVNYTLACGLMSIVCTRQADSPDTDALYACVSQRGRTIPGVTEFLDLRLRTRDIPAAWLELDSRVNRAAGVFTAAQQCIRVRDRALVAGPPANDNAYACASSVAYIALTDDTRVFCAILYDALTDAQFGNRVPLLVCPNSGILLNCTMQSAYDPTYLKLVGQYACRADDASPRNRQLIDNHQFAMTCNRVDPFVLKSYGVRFDSGLPLHPVSDTDARDAVTSQAACVYVKSQCTTPGVDFFGCNDVFVQSTPREEFCDIDANPVVVEYAVFTCGALPRHPVFCSTRDTARFGWVRCRNAPPAAYGGVLNATHRALVAASRVDLTMDCAIAQGVMDYLTQNWLAQQRTALPANATREQVAALGAEWLAKPDLCEQVRRMCLFAITPSRTAADASVLAATLAAVNAYGTAQTTLAPSDAVPSDASTTLVPLVSAGSSGSRLSLAELLFDPNDYPQPRDNNTFACAPPAVACVSQFCQRSAEYTSYNDSRTQTNAGTVYMDAAAATAASSTPGGTFTYVSYVNTTNVTASLLCRPENARYALLCQGVPIACEVHAVTIAGRASTSYVCASTHTSLGELHTNAERQGLAWSYLAENGFACTVSASIFTMFRSAGQICQAVGATCVAQSGVTCLAGFAPTPEAPFCTLRRASNPIAPFFECSSLGVRCEWDALNQWLFCSAVAGSRIWHLASKFAAPPRADGRVGCVIAPDSGDLESSANLVRFYQFPETRCGVLHAKCAVQCATGYATLGADTPAPDLCEPFLFGTSQAGQTFTCDRQPIACQYTPLNVTLETTTTTSTTSSTTTATLTNSAGQDVEIDWASPTLARAYLTDPDYGRNARVWTCANLSDTATSAFPSSLHLRCPVSGIVLAYASDVCTAVRGACNVAGELECLGAYVATPDAPFCTTRIESLAPSDDCDCGVTWSNDVRVLPLALVRLNTAVPSVARAFAPGASGCNARGYLSTAQYLAACIAGGGGGGGDTTNATACAAMYVDVFGATYAQGARVTTASGGTAASTPWKASWCLWSQANPSAECATAPGQRLPLCTIECPAHTIKTTLFGGRAEYCCAAVPSLDAGGNPATCTLQADTRNCVLGRHDDAWYDAPRSSLLQLAQAVERARDPLAPVFDAILFPNQPCPANLFSDYTVFPLVTSDAVDPSDGATSAGSGGGGGGAFDTVARKLDDTRWYGGVVYETDARRFGASPTVTVEAELLRYTQARSMCYADAACYSFHVYRGGGYWSARAPVLPANVLGALDPTRLHSTEDAEAVYRYHRVRASGVARRGAVMTAAAGGSGYILERHAGYACDDDAFDWRAYVLQDARVLADVQQRVIQHLHDAGVPADVIAQLRYDLVGDALADATLQLEVCSIGKANATDAVNFAPQCVPAADDVPLAPDRVLVGRRVYVTQERVTQPSFTEHRYKRPLFVNLQLEQTRDGLRLDARDRALNQTRIEREEARATAYSTMYGVSQRAFEEAVRNASSSVGSATQCTHYWHERVRDEFDGLDVEKEFTHVRNRVPIFGTREGATRQVVSRYTAPSALLYYGSRAAGGAGSDDTLGDGGGSGADADTVFGVDTSIAPFIRIASDVNGAELRRETYVVGWADVPDDVFLLEFSSAWDLTAYFAARHYATRGLTSRDGAPPFDKRLAPNAACRIDTAYAPYHAAPFVTVDPATQQPSIPADALRRQPVCVVPRCAMPVRDGWNWYDGTTTTPASLLDNTNTNAFPDPIEAEVPKRWDAVPCGGHGVCQPRVVRDGTSLRTPPDAYLTGVCVCDAAFRTYDSAEHAVVADGVRAVPRALRNLACDVDVRGRCVDAANGIAQTCAAHGLCVTAFNGAQTAECRCGTFEADCAATSNDAFANARVPRVCEARGLTWTDNGFDRATDAFCRAPRAGCRNATRAWTRPSGAYQRPWSYGCEVLRTNTAIGLRARTGRCRATVGGASGASDYACACASGNYGSLCQYRSLQGGCFDATAVGYQTPVVDASNAVTQCYWNAEIGQYQPVEWLVGTVSPGAIDALEQIACGAPICSKRGTCVHANVDEPAWEVYDAPLDPGNLLTSANIPSAAKSAFQVALRARLLAQTCVCPAGYTGRMCELRDCVGGCGRGTCDRSDANAPVCRCPMSSAAVHLTQRGTTDCGGFTCGSTSANETRGTLVRTDVPGGAGAGAGAAWSCACLAPYYQNTAYAASYSGLCASYCDPATKKLTTYQGQLECVYLSKAERAVLNGGGAASSTGGTGTRSSSTGASTAHSSTGVRISASSSTGVRVSSTASGSGARSSTGGAASSSTGGGAAIAIVDPAPSNSVGGGVSVAALMGAVAGAIAATLLVSLGLTYRTAVGAALRTAGDVVVRGARAARKALTPDPPQTVRRRIKTAGTYSTVPSTT